MTNSAYRFTGHAAVLPVKDMPTALAYYRDRLGFSVQFPWDEPTRYACLCLGDAAIHLNNCVPVAKSIVRIFCKRIDALHGEFVARGGTITRPVTDEPCGMREFEVTDSDGHRLIFGEALPS